MSEPTLTSRTPPCATARTNPLKKLWLMLLSIGPAVFGIGYTIGTGSVTSMSKAGSQYGSQLLWVLALSCLFSWAVMEAYGRYAVVTGQTAIHAFRTKFRGGRLFGVVVASGIVIGQWCCLSGLVGLTANALYEALRRVLPSLPADTYGPVLIISAGMLLLMYLLLLVGRYSFFEKVLLFFVSVLAMTFMISMLIVLPGPKEIAAGFVPRVPRVPGAALMIAAFVGTTMGGPTFITRPLCVKSKGWTIKDLKLQSRDSFFYSLLVFVVSGSIMLCAAGALFKQGLVIESVLDMVRSIEPVAGRYAVFLFLAGTVSAGASSMLPILMVAPLMISDYSRGELNAKTKTFKALALLACGMGLIVPILGTNPIAAQITTQVSLVFVLPLVVLGAILLVNDKQQMGPHRAGLLLNIGLALAFGFSLGIALTGVIAVMDLFK